jgi:hypothetical protein
VDGHMASSKSELSWRTVVRGSGFGEARRESHIRTRTRRMKSYGSRTCGLESPSNLSPAPVACLTAYQGRRSRGRERASRHFALW